MSFWDFYGLGSVVGATTPTSTQCDCVGKDGKKKNLYATRAEAEQMAVLRTQATGVHMNVYECPFGRGFHITSNQRQW